MWHPGIILSTGLKYLAPFSFIKRTSSHQKLLPPRIYPDRVWSSWYPKTPYLLWSTCLIRRLPPSLVLASPEQGCICHGKGTTLAAVRRGFAAVGLDTAHRDRPALAWCLMIATLLGIRRKRVRTLPRTSGIWITLSYIFGKYSRSELLQNS